nr:zinc finger, CCHC-type [Tanacetum cinerariifolium]
MLDKTNFASWQQRIRLYCRDKENVVNILQSIDEGPFQMETFWETLAEGNEGAFHLGPERPRVYSDLSPEEKERESQLYDDFEHFRQNKGETIHGYYVRFAKLISDMRNIKITMSRIQLNSKFVNNMLPERGRFVTTMKLNRGLRDSNYDQLYAYLKQHEAYANENKIMLDRFTQHTIDPLALMYNVSHQQYYSQSSTTPPSTYVQPHFADNTQLDSRLSPMVNLIKNLTNILAILTQSYKTYLRQTNNQLITLSNTRNQAIVQDGRVVVQNVQGRQNRGQGNNAQGAGATGYGGAQKRVGNANPDNAVEEDVDEQLFQDLALNVDNVFHADDCDAFDFDVNEAPTAHTMFMANLSSADPVYDKASPSYDSDILYEELHSVKMQLTSTINLNKSMVEEVTSLKKDFKQKENKYLKEYLDMKALKEKVEDKLYKQDQSLQTVHMLCKPKSYYDEQNKDLLKMKAEALKEQTTASRPIKVLMVYPPNTPVTLVPRVLPTTISRFSDMHEAFNAAQKRIADLESENSHLKNTIENDDHGVMIKHFSKLKVQHLNLQLKYQHLKESFENKKSVTSLDAPTFDSVFEIEQLKDQAQITENHKSNCVTMPTIKLKVLAPGMYVIDIEPIPPHNRNNRKVHLDYLKHLKESVATLYEIIEEDRVEKPLDCLLASAFFYTKHSQELVEYIIGSCLNDFNKGDKQIASTPVTKKKRVTFIDLCETSTNNTLTHVKQQNMNKTNEPVIPSTRVKGAAAASRIREAFRRCFLLELVNGYEPIPVMPVPPAGQVLPSDVLNTHTAWVKASKKIAGLMLMTMDLDIQKNLEHLGAYDMLKELKTLYAQQADQKLLQTVREFHACKQEEGQPEESRKNKKKKSHKAAKGNQRKGKAKMGYAPVQAPPFAPKPKNPPTPKKDNLAKDAICCQCSKVALRGSRKLKSGALSLYLSDGHRASVEAIREFHFNKRAKLNLDSALLWHCRLGHISKKCIEKLQHDGLLDSTDIKSFEKYVSCMCEKMEKKPYSHQVERAKDILGLIYTDALVKRDTLTKPDKLEPKSIKYIFIGYPKEMMRYSFYYPPENKVFAAQNAEFLENSLIAQEASETLEDLKIIQEEDMHPSLHTSLNHEEDDQEIDEPQRDLGEPANYKAALLDPESDKWLNAMNVDIQSMRDNKV